MSDLIDRQEALDALERSKKTYFDRQVIIGAMKDIVRNLPSAQPETHDERTETHACDLIDRQPSYSCSHENDTISRTAAIDATWFEPSYTDPLNVLTEVRDRLKVLPSIPPERKRGKWLPDNNPGGGFWVCSCCKFPSEAFAADKLYKYCPVCGCRMDEGD